MKRLYRNCIDRVDRARLFVIWLMGDDDQPLPHPLDREWPWEYRNLP